MSGEEYFRLSLPKNSVVSFGGVQASIYVHDVRFDTAFSSPVLDVSYCFLDTKPLHVALSCHYTLHDPFDYFWSFPVSDAEYKLLKEIFNYCSRVTCCASSAERHTVTLPLEKHGVWKYFDHAILFPLYPNPTHPEFQS